MTISSSLCEDICTYIFRGVFYRTVDFYFWKCTTVINKEFYFSKKVALKIATNSLYIIVWSPDILAKAV